MNPKTKDRVEKGILLIPLILAFLWMGVLVLNVQQPEVGARLAPSRLDALVTALFTFIILYAGLLFFIFYKMNKNLKGLDLENRVEAHKAPAKKARKKK
jgi:hypothetical protein